MTHLIAGEDIPAGPRFVQIKPDGKVYCVGVDQAQEGGDKTVYSEPITEDCDQPAIVHGEA